MIPPRLHVSVMFMLQFILLIGLLGGVLPTLHRKGISWVVLVPAAVVVLVLLHVLIGVLGKLVPVKCSGCKSKSRFQGFGWWPFIYRYTCTGCGGKMRFEVG